MRIEFRIGYLDNLKFQVVHQFLSPVMNGFFIAIAGAIVIVEMSGHTAVRSLLVAALFYLGMWAAQIVLVAILVFSRRNDCVLTDHVLEIRDGGLFEATKFNESMFFWPGLIKVVKRPGFVAVYIAQHMAHIIPDRAFRSIQERDQFVSLVQEKMRTA